MKASSFARPDLLLAAAYAAAHVPFLAPSLEDIDSINFALALRDFDPAEHQPHPPGYPIYVVLGRAALVVVNALNPGLEPTAAEAAALSSLSILAGAAALVFAWRLFDAIAAPAPRWAAPLLAVCPLFWITGVRPMSDMPGLAAAFAAQWLLLAGRLRAGAFLAGFGLGVRSQTLWLTAPLLAFVLAERHRGGGAWRGAAAAIACAAAGALAWAVPMVIATGGLDAYIAALGSQAGEDFAHVDMLFANPTPRRLAFGLIHTLVMPWASIPLAAAMTVLGATGACLLLLRNRRALALVFVLFAPYALFHLVFQETVTVRYALPVMPAVAYLAATALALAGPATNVVAMPVAALSLIVAVPATFAYRREPHPAFRAIADAGRRADASRPALVTSHFELRRPLTATEPHAMPVAYAPRQREWLELVRYWSSGGRGMAWFLANPRRTDLELIDRHSRSDVVRYHWPAGERPELSGTRPADVDWYRIPPPGWFLGEGWSLTPETGGVAREAGTGPDRRPITGWVRRSPGPMHAIVGGRHLGAAADGPASFELALDGAVLDRWTVTHAETNFLRFLDLPDGIDGPEATYATLTVRASAVPAAIRQFDIQPVSRPIFGFAAGWHESEYDSATGLRWRWTSDRATLRVRGPARPIRVRIRGESTRRYFDRASVIELSAGARTIERMEAAADWEMNAVVPAEIWSAANGELTLATSQVFTPAEVTGSPDTRRLGLRVFALDVESAR